MDYANVPDVYFNIVGTEEEEGRSTAGLQAAKRTSKPMEKAP